MAEQTKTAPLPGEEGYVAPVTPPVTSNMVPEKDLLALKSGKEKAELERDTVQTQLETAKNESGTYYNRAIAAEAKITSFDELTTNFNNATVERDKHKTDLDAAIVERDKAKASALEFKRAAIKVVYGIPDNSIENKSLEELAIFEDALKAVGQIKGIGNYAVGGGGGGPSTPETPLERASRQIEEARKAGHVYGGTMKVAEV